MAVAAVLVPAASADAQQVPPATVAGTVAVPRDSTTPVALDALLALARTTSPRLRAARARLEAARARVAPSFTRPDPMLMVGIQNLPLGRERAVAPVPGAPASGTGSDPMTMRMVGVSQVIPLPRKLTLRRRVAESEVEAANASLDVAVRQLDRDLADAYYELAFLERARTIVARHQSVLAGFVRVTEARYGAGTAGQPDVLKARVEAARLAETAVALGERRRATLAALNALVGRPSETPASAAVPAPIARAAVAESAQAIRFTSSALGARAAGSPLPSLGELQALARVRSPALREHEAMIAAQIARVALARTAVLPDVEVSLQYGQRPGRPDMLSATVAVPLPVQRHAKQDPLVTEAGAELAALEAEHRATVDAIEAEVARLVTELERQRAQLALYVSAILPQAHAALAAAAAGYQAGTTGLLAVLDIQSTVFTYETDYHRALSDFGKQVAELERVVGTQVLR